MGSVDDVATMCTVGPSLVGDGGYIKSSDDEAAPSGCWVPDQADMRAEEDAVVNTIFVRWGNVLRYPVLQIGEPEGWLFDGYPIQSMLDVYAHGMAEEGRDDESRNDISSGRWYRQHQVLDLFSLKFDSVHLGLSNSGCWTVGAARRTYCFGHMAATT